MITGAGADAAIVAHGSVLDPSITNATVSYLTNGADTRSRGVDATATYSSNFGEFGSVKWTAGLNLNRNVITKVSLATGLNPASASQITDATPKSKLILGANYYNGNWSGNLRGYSQAYVYPSFSPFGINGAFYYAKASYQF